MSTVTIYNDGTKDAQIVVLNYLTNKPAVHHALPVPDPDDQEPIQVELGNGDIIIVNLADAPVEKTESVQKVIEELVQWEPFSRIWGESTPREKDNIRKILAGTQ